MALYKFEELKEIFEGYISRNRLEHEPQGLYKPVNYIMGLKGKRIRPVACLMTANIFMDDITPALPVALAIEMFHNFTLMHDDIMDDADLRRAQPTVHVKYDTNTAILSGDLMMIMSYNYLINCCEDIIVKDKLLRLFTDTAIQVCEGQQYDMDFENAVEPGLEDYLLMIKLKTAVLVAGTFKAGAIIGGASEEDARNFYHFGLNLGLAFQIQDDLLDTYGDQNNFGKKIGGDIVQNKKTYLYIKTMEIAGEEDKNTLRQLYSGDNMKQNEKISRVKHIFDKYNIKQLAEEQVRQYTDKALKHFDALSVDKSLLGEIKNLAGFLLKRKV